MSLNPEQLEPLTKAAHTANLLVQDLREAHKSAGDDQPALEILLRILLGDAWNGAGLRRITSPRRRRGSSNTIRSF